MVYATSCLRERLLQFFVYLSVVFITEQAKKFQEETPNLMMKNLLFIFKEKFALV